MPDFTKPIRRTCEGCTLCCKLVPVAELNKPANKWCDHVLSRRTPLGCMIYPDRPNGCRQFECLWLNTSLPAELHPRAIHSVLYSVAGTEIVNVYCDPDYDLEENHALWNWVSDASRIYRVEIFYGDRRFTVDNRPKKTVPSLPM